MSWFRRRAIERTAGFEELQPERREMDGRQVYVEVHELVHDAASGAPEDVVEFLALDGYHWMPGDKAARQYLKVARTNVDKNAACFQMSVVGRFPNRDVVIPL